MNLKSKVFTLFIIVVTELSINAQDDLLNSLDSVEAKPQKVLATFKTTRIVNGHSIETVKARGLDFRVTHHFGDIGGSAGGPSTFFGLDDAADIRIAFEYGINDNLTVGLGRSKISQMIDGYLKYRLFTQTVDSKVPISTTLFINTGFTPVKNSNNEYDNFAHRFSYVYQVIFARKFNKVLSLQLSPTYLHRNYVGVGDENDLFSLGMGARVKLTKHFAILADYFFTFADYDFLYDPSSKYAKQRRAGRQFHAPLGVGIEIETGGHVFHIFFTNNAGILENNFIANTTSAWTKGEFKLGFNISRTFGIGKKQTPSL